MRRFSIACCSSWPFLGGWALVGGWAIVGGCALLSEESAPPTEPTGPRIPTETFVTTPATFPAFMSLGASFGWDAVRERTVEVVVDGEPVAPGVRILLGSLAWDLATGSPEACEVTISLANRGPAAPAEGDWWLAVDVGEAPGGAHGCAGFDLSAFPEGDPVALLSTGPFAGWTVGIGGEPDPLVVEDAADDGIPADQALGALLASAGFGSTLNLARAFALDPDGALVLVDGERVPLTRDEVGADAGPPTAYYEVTHWLDYYLP